MASQRNWGLLFILGIKNSGFCLVFSRRGKGGSAPKIKHFTKGRPARPFWNGRFGSQTAGQTLPFLALIHLH